MKEVYDIAGLTEDKMFWYGLRMRPAGLGCHPRETVAIISNVLASSHFTLLSDKNDVRHGAIAYANPLSEEQISQFELVDLNNLKPVDLTQDGIVIMTEAVHIMLGWFSGSLSNPKDVRELVGEIEDDGDYLFREACKELSVFTNRKEHPKAFAQFRVVFKTINTDVLIQHINGLVAKVAA